jgi:hypothetical protein
MGLTEEVAELLAMGADLHAKDVSGGCGGLVVLHVGGGCVSGQSRLGSAVGSFVA